MYKESDNHLKGLVIATVGAMVVCLILAITYPEDNKPVTQVDKYTYNGMFNDILAYGANSPEGVEAYRKTMKAMSKNEFSFYRLVAENRPKDKENECSVLRDKLRAKIYKIRCVEGKKNEGAMFADCMSEIKDTLVAHIAPETVKAFYSGGWAEDTIRFLGYESETTVEAVTEEVKQELIVERQKSLDFDMLNKELDNADCQFAKDFASKVIRDLELKGKRMNENEFNSILNATNYCKELEFKNKMK